MINRSKSAVIQFKSVCPACSRKADVRYSIGPNGSFRCSNPSCNYKLGSDQVIRLAEEGTPIVKSVRMNGV